MKKRILNGIAVVLLTAGISTPSHASVACVAPGPACAVVLLGALVTGIVSETREGEEHHLQAGRKRSALEAIVDDIKNAADDGFASRFRNAAGAQPGFHTIVRRFEQGHQQGPGSLQSLMRQNPKLFDDLDRIASLIGQHYPREVMTESYGPRRLADGEVNWDRYATLARDALMIHHSMSANDA